MLPFVKVPFIVSVPAVSGEVPDVASVPPLLTVIAPVNDLAPVLANVSVPEILLVPVTVNVQVLVAPVVREVPAPTLKFPPIVVITPVVTDGYTSNRSIYLTYADTNNDGVPDNPKLFELLVGNTVGSNYVFFKSVTGYGRFIDLVQVDNNLVIVTAHTPSWIQTNIATYDVGQLFYLTATESFRQITGTNASKTLSQPLTDYIVYAGRQDILYQYRHNAPNDRRIDPSTSNLIDLYVLTSAYDTEYRQWIQDTSNTIAKPDVPTSIELAVQFAELNNVKAISDSIVYQNAVFKPIFGSKANSKLQATFKVVKNPTLNISDADIKTSVISAINTYFSIANWDFGDDFYFSELSAYLHQTLSPNIASIVIVPKDVTVSFGSLYQINADPTEIIISAATVNDVEIITAVTAGQLNQSLASSNRSITF